MTGDLLETFREELLELVQSLEEGLLALEASGSGERTDPEQLGNTFRAAHNIKAAAGMIGLTAAAEAAHTMESVLDELRSGGALDRGMITRLLGGVDALRTLVRGGDVSANIVQRLGASSPVRDLRVSLRFSEDTFAAALDPLSLLRAASDLGEVVSSRTDDARLPPLDDLDPEQLCLGFELVLRTTASADDVRSVFLFAEDHLELSVVELPSGGAAPSGDATPDGGHRPEGIETLAVSVRRVDTLVDLASEMSIAASQVEQLRCAGAATTEGQMEVASREVKRLAGRLQEAAMAMRLVPMTSTFGALRRFVRDQALRLGKDVLVEVQGAHTELDKSVAERLSDPLKHLVRNALDHGLELPSDRERIGKPREGRLVLSARQQQGAVVLVVEDDGRGLDPARIHEAALRRGLIKPDSALSEEEVLELVFLPGLSTVELASELSGRGVGLDVVRRNILDLGGALHVSSEPGKGTRFSLHVPLTLAVLDGLVLRCGGERLVVPIDSVQKLLRPKPGQIARLPEGREILWLPERSVPLLRPAEVFGAGEADAGKGAVVVLVETAAGPVALLVDEVLSQEAVMLKPLQRGLKVGGDGVLGATILADGGVALVLDVARLPAFCGIERAARVQPFAHEP